MTIACGQHPLARTCAVLFFVFTQPSLPTSTHCPPPPPPPIFKLQNSEKGSKGDFIAKIEKIYTDKNSEVQLDVRWYYRPEETVMGRMPWHARCVNKTSMKSKRWLWGGEGREDAHTRTPPPPPARPRPHVLTFRAMPSRAALFGQL